MDFHNIALNDIEKYKTFAANNCRSAYNFVTNFVWSAGEKVKISYDNNTLFILWNLGKNSFMLFPQTDEKNIEKSVKLAIDYMESLDIIPSFHALNEQEVMLLKKMFPKLFIFDYDRNNSDYIYDAKKLGDLSGKKLHSKKNHYNVFCRNNKFIYKNISVSDVKQCKELFGLWYNEKDESTRLLKESRDATFTLLDNMQALGVKGSIIEVDGSIVACTIGEQITDDMALIHIEYANTAYPGSYAVINKEFVKNEWYNLKYINREEDMGDEGLRKAKLSYNPQKLLNEYIAKIKK